MPVKKAAEKPDVKAEAVEGKEKKRSMTELVRRVLLAGVGAMVLAQEEVEDLVDRLVDKGEIAEQDGKKLVKEMMERRKKATAKVEAKVEAKAAAAEKNGNRRVERIVNRVLDQANIPTRKDIEALNKQVGELAEKVDELKKQPA